MKFARIKPALLLRDRRRGGGMFSAFAGSRRARRFLVQINKVVKRHTLKERSSL